MIPAQAFPSLQNDRGNIAPNVWIDRTIPNPRYNELRCGGPIVWSICSPMFLSLSQGAPSKLEVASGNWTAIRNRLDKEAKIYCSWRSMRKCSANSIDNVGLRNENSISNNASGARSQIVYAIPIVRISSANSFHHFRRPLFCNVIKHFSTRLRKFLNGYRSRIKTIGGASNPLRNENRMIIQNSYFADFISLPDYCRFRDFA